MCGEKHYSCAPNSQNRGSPPRVRGKDFCRLYACQRVGITPACAGKSFPAPRSALSEWDHPRVCGEKLTSFLSVIIPKGSPPRVRGKVARASAATTARGITPACAGKSAPWAKQKGGVGDHPRVCGEKAFHLIFPPLSWGSPPRVRGKVFSPALWMPLPKDHPRVCGEKLSGATRKFMRTRITPACAGKSASLMYFRAPGSDHPRVCGEKRYGACVGKRNVGSPPRVRGKGFLAMATGCATRITPACAGKRLDFGRDCRMGDGSPPRVRGKDGHIHVSKTPKGITPACAGKSQRLSRDTRSDRDHPRVCGEKNGCGRIFFERTGSPPRVRGKV